MLEVDFWSDVNAQDAVWWSAIRKWKLGAGVSWASWASWAANAEAEVCPSLCPLLPFSRSLCLSLSLCLALALALSRSCPFSFALADEHDTGGSASGGKPRRRVVVQQDVRLFQMPDIFVFRTSRSLSFRQTADLLRFKRTLGHLRAASIVGCG